MSEREMIAKERDRERRMARRQKLQWLQTPEEQGATEDQRTAEFLKEFDAQQID